MQGASRASLAEVSERFDASTAEVDDEALRRAAGELYSVVSLLDGEPALRRSLSDPALPARAKVSLADQLFASRLGAVALEAVRLAARQRWARPRDLADALEELASVALFLVAERSGEIDEVEDQLFRFARIIDREPGLWAALSDPALPTARKEELVGSLLAGKVAAVTSQLVGAVVAAPRGRMVDTALEELARIAARRQSRLIAQVRSAVPLSEPERDRLASRLAGMYGHGIHLQVELDPEVIGGLLVRVGDEVIDATVAARLADVARRIGRAGPGQVVEGSRG